MLSVIRVSIFNCQTARAVLSDPRETHTRRIVLAARAPEAFPKNLPGA
jgi:hypothetical protein